MPPLFPPKNGDILSYWSTHNQTITGAYTTLVPVCPSMGHLATFIPAPEARAWSDYSSEWDQRQEEAMSSQARPGAGSQAEGGHSSERWRKRTEEVDFDQSRPDHWKLLPSGWLTGVLIGLYVSGWVWSHPDAQKLLMKDFSSSCDVISRSQKGHSRATVMSPQSRCRVTVMSEGHHEVTSTDHCSSNLEIENFDWLNQVDQYSRNYLHPG